MRREKIVQTIQKRLKTIRTDNGYDWEPNVFEWLASPLGPSDLPAIVIKDTEDSVDSQRVSDASEHHLKIELMLFVQDGKETPSSLRKKMSDILKIIGKEQAQGEDMGDYISFDSNAMAVEQEERIKGGVIIEITVVYYTAKWEI